jgi:hypothetical protein
MKRRRAGSPQLVVVTLSAVVLLGGTVWGFMAWNGSDKSESTLPDELRLENLRKQASDDPDGMRTTMANSFRRDDLTEEQRREARENMRTVFEEQMDKNVNEYFTAPEEEKVAVLDRQIDEFQKQMEGWRAQMEEMRKEREARQAEREKNGEKPDGERDGGERRWGGPQTREERKARSESNNPDKMAKRFAYFSAAHKRMTERGIEMPFGRGGFGGMGRGPGGPGGGPGRP